jgi:ABC-2 type transport system ATP-binding protein
MIDLATSASTTPTPVISTQGLSKDYRVGWFSRKTFRALVDVNLEVHRGEVFALLGPNGAGKTTLIKLLLGIIHPSRGRARVLDETAGSRLARQRIGYLPENLVVPKHHTAEGALYFYGRLHGMSESLIQSRVKPLLQLVGLLGRERELVRKYSKGMKQRLGLAQALLHEPEILILDEPTDGLDPLGRSQIRELIEQIRDRGKTVFLNSHILQEVELVCDRVAIMSHGNIRDTGTLSELVERNASSDRLRVDFELYGPLAEIQRLLAESDGENLGLQIDEAMLSQSDGAVRCQVTLDLLDQTRCDQWIDRFRASKVSILNVARHRPSLETIFVDLVQNRVVGQAARLAKTPS